MDKQTERNPDGRFLRRQTMHGAAVRTALILLVSTVVLASCATAPQGVQIENPVIRDIYSADAAALVSGDTVYLYVGHDEAAKSSNNYAMYDWYCYSTKDMKKWESHGAVLKVTAFKWAVGNAWASQVAERDGKFYYYTCVNMPRTGGMAIGVAVSDSPTGPFVDAIGGPLITSDMTPFPGQKSWTWDDIDPTVLIDDDGQAYMYFGNSYLKYVKLNPDMISVDVSGTASGEVKDAIVKVDVPRVAGLGFTEAPWLHERNGTYYLSYAAGWEEQLAYAMSDSPTGPWKAGGLLMTHAFNSNTSHQAIVEFKGKWYIFYHNGMLPGGNSWHRSVCAAELTYDENGKMNMVQGEHMPYTGPTAVRK